MILGYAEYRGKRYKLLDYDGAVKEYEEQKARGKKPVIISEGEGYIVADAIFGEPEGGGK